MPHRHFLHYCLSLFLVVIASAQSEDMWPASVDLPPQPRAPSCYIYRAQPIYTDPAQIKIFVTNDVHGYVFQDESRKLIGYALLQGYIENAQKQGFQTILMDAGDTFSGNALAQYDAGLGVAELMGRMGYRVMTPGNHAFDYNASSGNMRYYSDILVKTVSNFAMAPLDVACVNLTPAEPLPYLSREPVTVIDENNFRLVVIGVITPYAKSDSSPENTAGFYDFGLVETNGLPDHAATRQRLIERVAQAAAPYDRPGDVVVLLSHVGVDTTADYAKGQIRGPDFAAIPNIDFVVDAHSHNHTPVRRIGAAQYGNTGRYLESFAEITLSREGDAVRGNMELIDYDQAKRLAQPSQEILARLRELSDRLGLGDELFRVSGDLLTDKGIGEGSTPLGRFICKTMNDCTGADLAVFNSGGIRSGIADGWVTLGTLYDMIPFQNNLVTFSMTGAELAAFFRDMPERKTNRFPQFYGMSVYAWEQGGGALGIAGIRDASGAPLDPERKYTVAINSFMAGGGDGYSFSLADKRDRGDMMALFVQYLRAAGSPALEPIRNNDTLLVYPTRGEAERAFREAEAIRPAA